MLLQSHSVCVCSESCCSDHFPSLLGWPFCVFSLVPLFLFIRCLLCFSRPSVACFHTADCFSTFSSERPWQTHIVVVPLLCFQTAVLTILDSYMVATVVPWPQRGRWCPASLAFPGQQCLKFSWEQTLNRIWMGLSLQEVLECLWNWWPLLSAFAACVASEEGTLEKINRCLFLFCFFFFPPH